MSKLGKVTARFKTINLGTEEEPVEFRIFPLKNKEFLDIMALMEDNKGKSNSAKEGFTKMVETTLKKDDPTITKEEVENLDFDNTMKVINTTTELSGLGKPFDFKKIFEDEMEKKSMTKQKTTSEGISKAESLRRELIEEAED